MIILNNDHIRSLLSLQLYLLASHWVLEGGLDEDGLVQLKMLVPFLVVRVLGLRQTITINAVFSLLVFTVLDFTVILAVWLEELFRSCFNPFLLLCWPLLDWLSIWYFFLLHKVEIKASLDHNFDEKVFPVIK